MFGQSRPCRRTPRSGNDRSGKKSAPAVRYFRAGEQDPRTGSALPCPSDPPLSSRHAPARTALSPPRRQCSERARRFSPSGAKVARTTGFTALAPSLRRARRPSVALRTPPCRAAVPKARAFRRTSPSLQICLYFKMLRTTRDFRNGPRRSFARPFLPLRPGRPDRAEGRRAEGSRQTLMIGACSPRVTGGFAGVAPLSCTDITVPRSGVAA